MINSLYDNFKIWSGKGSVYLISDPHFNDKDNLLINPKWISADEYISLLNKNIHKNDTLICLGDCGDLDCIKQLKAGYKVLIKGNHDDKGNGFYKRTLKKEIYDKEKISEKELRDKLTKENPYCKIQIFEDYQFHSPFHRLTAVIDNNLFDEVYNGPLFISDKILLSHEPINGLSFCVNIHGHSHNYYYEYIDSQGGKHINIASDVVEWKIINLNDLIKLGLVSNIPSIHRIAIDKASENPIKKGT